MAKKKTARKKTNNRKPKKKLVHRRKALKPINLKRELAAGIKVELEHTKRMRSRKKARQVAKRIAMDHLRETPYYYRRLRKCFPHEHHNDPGKKWEAPPGKVKLERFFWGHQKGTKGRISGGKLRLRGSPAANLHKRDEGSLYSRRNPGSPGKSCMIVPFRVQGRNPVSKEDMELMNRLVFKMNQAARRAGRTNTDTADLAPSERAQYRKLRAKFDTEIAREFPRYHEGMGGSPSYNPKTIKNYIVKELMPDWKRRIDPRSIRTKTIITKAGGKRLLRIGCPKGEWMPRVKRCKVGTKAISMLTPKSEKILSLHGKAAARRAASNPTRGMNPRKKIGGGLTAKKLEKFLRSIPFLPSGITVIQGGPGYQKRWARHLAKEKKELARLDAEYYKEFPEMRRYHPKRSTNPRDERSRMAVSGQRHG